MTRSTHLVALLIGLSSVAVAIAEGADKACDLVSKQLDSGELPGWKVATTVGEVAEVTSTTWTPVVPSAT